MVSGTGKGNHGAKVSARPLRAVPKKGAGAKKPPEALAHIHTSIDPALHLKAKVYAVTYRITMQDLAIQGITHLMAATAPDLGEVDPKKAKDTAVHFAIPSDLHIRAKVFAAMNSITLRHLVIRGLQTRLEKGRK